MCSENVCPGSTGERSEGLRSIHFILPGVSVRPVGGYKVVYEYANYLARKFSSSVSVYVDYVNFSKLSTLERIPALGVVRSVAATSRGKLWRSFGKPWYRLESGVHENVYWHFPDLHLSPDDVVVATSCHTVPFVTRSCKSSGASGLYFIQHFEDWSAPRDFVESTWRAGLRNIVIAPWLEDIGHSLGVPVVLVPNAIDGSNFVCGPALRDRAPMVLAMISPVPYKRADIIEKAFALIHRLAPDIRLGTFGVQQRPRSLPDYVAHTQQPSRAELVDLYQKATVYMTASEAEGWHLPPAEALLCGSSLVSSDIGGVRAYADGIARFVPVGDAARLAHEAIIACRELSDSQSRVDKGRARLLSYSPDDAAQRFSLECLKGNTRPSSL